MKIYLTKVNSYGRQRIYPNCTQSKILCELMKKKTFFVDELELIKKLGFKVTFELPEHMKQFFGE